MTKWTRWAAAGSACLIAAMAVGQQPDPNVQATNYRQSLMRVIAGNAGPLGAMARDRMPYNAALAEKNVTRVAFLAGMISDAFVRDTSSADVETAAKPEIWANHAEFDRLANETRMKAEAAVTAVRGGNEAAAKSALGAIFMTCGGCHDEYRVEDE